MSNKSKLFIRVKNIQEIRKKESMKCWSNNNKKGNWRENQRFDKQK